MGSDGDILGGPTKGPSPVYQALTMGPEEALKSALETFQSPECVQVDNCYIIDYTDVFKPVPASPQRLPPQLTFDQKGHLTKGLNWLLASLRYVPWILGETHAGGDLSEIMRDQLTRHYLHAAKKEMQQGGVGGAIFSQIALMEGGLETGRLQRQGEVELAIRGIILGYTIYLQNKMGIELDWEVARQRMQDRKEEVSKPSVALPATPFSIPQEREVEGKGEPMPAKPKPLALERPKGRGKLLQTPPPSVEKKVPEPPKELHPGSKTTPKRKQLEGLAKATGGELQDILPSEDIGKAVKKRLTIDKGLRHYQVLFLIDASGSMEDNVKELQEKIPALMKHAKRQLMEGGEVSFGVRYYVDETKERPVPLESYETLLFRANVKKKEGGDLLSRIWNRLAPSPESGVRNVMRGLSQALKHIQGIGGSYEYHWEVGMEAMKGEPWASNADVERVIFLLTDEEGDIGEKGYTQKDVTEEARKRGIRFEIIRCLEGGEGMSIEEAAEILSYPLGRTSRYNSWGKMIAAFTLGSSRSPRFIPHLTSALDPRKESDAEVRRWAARAMGEIGDLQAIPYLTSALDPRRESEWEVRRAAAEAMGKIGDPKAIPHLTSALDPRKESDVEVRRNAAEAMGKIGDLQAIPYLTSALDPRKESDVEVRRWAARAMGEIRDSKVIPFLKKAAEEDPNPNVRMIARRAIQHIKR